MIACEYIVQKHPIICSNNIVFRFTAMAESRMSSCWVERRVEARLRAQAEEQIVAFARPSRSWTSSQHRKLTTRSMCWTNAPSPPSTTSRRRYHRQRARPRPALHPPALDTLVLRPP